MTVTRHHVDIPYIPTQTLNYVTHIHSHTSSRSHTFTHTHSITYTHSHTNSFTLTHTLIHLLMHSLTRMHTRAQSLTLTQARTPARYGTKAGPGCQTNSCHLVKVLTHASMKPVNILTEQVQKGPTCKKAKRPPSCSTSSIYYIL